MNKTPQPHYSNKKVASVPGFLQNKQTPSRNSAEGRAKKPLQSPQEYETLSFSNPITRSLFHKRICCWLKNTPRIIIESQTPESLTILLQNPKKLLTEHLKPYRRSAQLEKALQIVHTLFSIVQLYGYFYCDRQMMRVSEDGSPVIWMHERFKQNQREFPIKTSSVSELIFVKKVKETLGDFLQFPKNLELESKRKLVTYLENERERLAGFEKFPSLSITNMPKLLLTRELSSTNFSYRALAPVEKESLKSIKLSTPNKAVKQDRFYLTSCHQSKDKDRNSERSCKKRGIRDILGNRDRIKTTKFQDMGYIIERMGGAKKEKSEKIRGDKKESLGKEENQEKNSKEIKIVQLSKSRGKHSKNSPKPQNSQDEPQKQQTIYDQFNFQPQQIDPSTQKKHRDRKQSADVDSWHRKQKSPQVPFQHSTFSTSVTFSSLKAQLETSTEQEQQKQKDRKPENYVITHLYSVEKQKQTKEKLNADIKKIMKQSDMKIKEEDSFQNQVDNLLDSDVIQNQGKKITTRESLLIEEFEKLFNTTKKDEEIDPQIMQELQGIL